MNKKCWIKLAISLLLLAPLNMQSQEPVIDNHLNGPGIQWSKGLSWEQVKVKAKKDGKYIFLDCFTTWCGPCKRMNTEVFNLDTVGRFINSNFISVKVQMDRTAMDGEDVKKWYQSADSLLSQYSIRSYPCYLFFSPEGTIVHKEVGYKASAEFIAIAKEAILPGRSFYDPTAGYLELKKNFLMGNIIYDSLPAMIEMAEMRNDSIMRMQLIRTHVDISVRLPKEKRYLPRNIECWVALNPGINTKLFKMFYADAKFIDKVMKEEGYVAANIVEPAIMYEIAIPFLEQEAAESGVAMTGGYLTDISGKNLLQADYREAHWYKLAKLISKRFNRYYAQRVVLKSKIEWYTRHWNYGAAAKYSLIYLNKYPPTLKKGVSDRINAMAWNAFMYVNEKEVLYGYIRWMEKVIKAKPTVAAWIDTYANLLYKVGLKDQAIGWQGKAVSLSPSDKDMQEALYKMKLGQPTYVHRGAVWLNN